MLSLARVSVFKTTKLIESIRRSKMDGDFFIFYRFFLGFQGQPRQSDKKVLIFVKYRRSSRHKTESLSVSYDALCMIDHLRLVFVLPRSVFIENSDLRYSRGTIHSFLKHLFIYFLLKQGPSANVSLGYL